MEFEVRPCASVAEVGAAITPIGSYFGRSAPEAGQAERLVEVMPVERVYAAWEGDRAIGGLGAYPFALTVPGGRVAASGVTVAGVLPSHRRRGVLRAMMRALLDACHRRGEPVAYLWATEDTIYGRFGFGLASFTADIDLPRERSAFHAQSEDFGRVRLVSPEAAREQFVPIYERVAGETPGMIARSAAWWQTRILADPPWRREADGDLQCAVLEDAGRPAGYALYRMSWSHERDVRMGAVSVVEAIGQSPAATRAVWRYLLDIDLMARVRASLLPVDHPLLLLSAEPRRLGFRLRDGVWVRLLDVGKALAARSYRPCGAVVVDVTDEFCPWNAGSWRVGADGVERTDAAADLRCDVTALGAVYLGGFSWLRLVRALRVEEVFSGAAARADAVFATAAAPWCPEIF